MTFILGIYRINENCRSFDRSIAAFSMDGERKIEIIEHKNISVCHFQNAAGPYIHENKEEIIIFSGEPWFEKGFAEFVRQVHLESFQSAILAVKGLFTCCRIDKITGELKVANDYFGLFPVFILKTPDAFLFCNEYHPLVCADEQAKRLNAEAISQYFRYGFVFEGLTFFENISMLKARNLVSVSGNLVGTAEYDTFEPPFFDSYEASLKEVHSALSTAVKRTVSGSGNLAKVSLSAGLDTRMILALIPEAERSRLTFYSFFLSPLTEENDKDVIVAKRIAQSLNLRHEVEQFTPLTEKLTPDFFQQQRKPFDHKMITGLLGGELLSGVLYKIFAADTRKKIMKFPDFSKGNGFITALFLPFTRQRQLYRELARNGNHHAVYRYSFQVITRSFFTSIYGGTEGLWVNPWSHFSKYSTPFLDTDFLKILFRVPEQFIMDTNQQFYFDLYKFLPQEYKGYETNSFLPNLTENGFRYIEEGYEQKKHKLNKSSHLLGESLEYLKSESILLDDYRSRDQFEQRAIDFAQWKKHIDAL